MTGQTISHYRILAKLGAGGMGEVYRAEDVHLGRVVALKFLHSGQDVALLLREARAASTLNHPSICQVYEVDPDHGFLAIEYIEGRTLKELIGGRPLPVRQAVDLALQIGEGLRAAHAAGIIHRDIKPGNVMVTAGGQAKVMDFGLAKTAQPSGLTGDTTTSGTFGYMAPEQLAGRKIDTRCDIWAYGAVLHEMLTGRLPGGQTETLPEGLGRIIRKALAGDRDERYQHVDDMLVDLRKWQTPAKAPSKSRRWLIAGAAAVPVATAILLRNKFNGKSYSSLAVLPLENLSGDAQQEWFSDGMTETLISELSKVHSLRVISRTSVMQYKKQRKALKAIANELDVEAVVEGTAKRVGDRAYITAHLIDAATERHLWSEDFDRETGDVIALHRELARAIAREIRATLNDGEGQHISTPRKAKPEAVEAYLRGLHLRNKGPQNLPDQLKLARDAVRLDPEYALGHWLLARTLQSMGDYARAPYPDVVPEARAEIARALELEPDLAVAYQLLSWSLLTVDHDWEGAEKAARKAEELDPAANTSGVHFARGRIEQALEENRQNWRRDPLNVNVIANVGINLGALGRYGEALEVLRKAVAIEPENEYALDALRNNLFLAGRLDEAADATARLHAPENRAALLHVYRTKGWNDFCRESLRLRMAQPNRTAQAIARSKMMHGIWGRDHNAALEGLETLEKTGDAVLAQLALPIFHPIRNEPRFKAVLKRLRYPEQMWK